MNADFFDRDYYMRGIESRKSNYQQYRWLPEMTIPMVMTMIDLIDIKRDDKVLDIGCAFGFSVKAFRMLHRDAWGIDISEFAINNVDPAVKEHCFLPDKAPDWFKKTEFDVCIAKDVFEHIPHTEINQQLKNINGSFLFAIIPLGKDKKYFAPANDFDLSHEICETADWWTKTLADAGWFVFDYYDRVKGIKDSYDPGTHGFFLAER